MKNMEEGAEIIFNYVNKAIEKYEKNPSNSENAESIMEKLLKVDKQIASVLSTDMLGAGIDTVSVFFILNYKYLISYFVDFVRTCQSPLLPREKS
jgi:hypothetical protein